MSLRSDPEAMKAYRREESRRRRADPIRGPKQAAAVRASMKKRLDADPAYRESQGRKAKEWQMANPEKCREARRELHFRKNYGLSLEQLTQMVIDQDGCCAICNEPFGTDSTNCHVDHDHATGRVRGLLCRLCNLMLGKARDSKDILMNAIEYLSANSKTEAV